MNKILTLCVDTVEKPHLCHGVTFRAWILPDIGTMAMAVTLFKHPQVRGSDAYVTTVVTELVWFPFSFTPLIARWLCRRKGGRSNDWDSESGTLLRSRWPLSHASSFTWLPLLVVFSLIGDHGRDPRYGPKPIPVTPIAQIK